MRNQFVFCTQTYFSETKGAFHFSRRTLEFFSTLSTYGQVFFCFLWVVSGHFKSGLKLHKLSISVQIHPLINEVIFQVAVIQKLSTQYESMYQFRRSYRISLILHRFLRYIQALEKFQEADLISSSVKSCPQRGCWGCFSNPGIWEFC